MIWQWKSMWSGSSLYLVDSNGMGVGIYQNDDGLWNVGNDQNGCSLPECIEAAETCLKQSNKWTDGDVILPFGGLDYVAGLSRKISELTYEIASVREELRNLKRMLAEAVR